MPKKRKNYHAEPWKAFAARWRELYTAPGRPSKPDIAVYRRYIQSACARLKRKPRTLVLGATPELRDLLAQLKHDVTLADINMEMILAMSELINPKNPPETLVRADWSQTPLRTGYFDVVVGDLVIPNVTPDRRRAFTKEMHRLLKPGGAFVTRVFITPPLKEPRENRDEVIERYAHIPPGETRSHELFADLFMNIALDRRRMIFDIKKLRDVINEFRIKDGVYRHPNKNITQYLNKMWRMWQPMDKQWSAQTEANYMRMLSPYFFVQEKAVAGVCYYERMNRTFPLWYLEKR